MTFEIPTLIFYLTGGLLYCIGMGMTYAYAMKSKEYNDELIATILAVIWPMAVSFALMEKTIFGLPKLFAKPFLAKPLLTKPEFTKAQIEEMIDASSDAIVLRTSYYSDEKFFLESQSFARLKADHVERSAVKAPLDTYEEYRAEVERCKEAVRQNKPIYIMPNGQFTTDRNAHVTGETDNSLRDSKSGVSDDSDSVAHELLRFNFPDGELRAARDTETIQINWRIPKHLAKKIRKGKDWSLEGVVYKDKKNVTSKYDNGFTSLGMIEGFPNGTSYDSKLEDMKVAVDVLIAQMNKRKQTKKAGLNYSLAKNKPNTADLVAEQVDLPESRDEKARLLYLLKDELNKNTNFEYRVACVDRYDDHAKKFLDQDTGLSYQKYTDLIAARKDKDATKNVLLKKQDRAIGRIAISASKEGVFQIPPLPKKQKHQEISAKLDKMMAKAILPNVVGMYKQELKNSGGTVHLTAGAGDGADSVHEHGAGGSGGAGPALILKGGVQKMANVPPKKPYEYLNQGDYTKGKLNKRGIEKLEGLVGKGNVPEAGPEDKGQMSSALKKLVEGSEKRLSGKTGQKVDWIWEGQKIDYDKDFFQ